MRIKLSEQEKALSEQFRFIAKHVSEQLGIRENMLEEAIAHATPENAPKAAQSLATMISYLRQHNLSGLSNEGVIDRVIHMRSTIQETHLITNEDFANMFAAATNTIAEYVEVRGASIPQNLAR